MTRAKDGNDANKPTRVRKLHEPPPPSAREVLEHELADLRKSGISDETIKLAGLYTEHRPAALTDILGRTYARQWGNALVIPFHLPHEERAYAFRLRPAYPRTIRPAQNGKPAKKEKYTQASHAGVLVYLPPRARELGWLTDPSKTLYITEGEKKALIFDQLGMPCVGLTGVFCYKDESDDEGVERLHPTIRDHVTVAGRNVVICFDADARDNDQVMLAAGRLTGVLQLSGAADVRFVAPPTKNEKGIDDFFAAFGEPSVLALLNSASTIEPISPREPLARLKSIRALQEAPVSNDLRLPPDYRIGKDGVMWRCGSDDKHGDVAIARGPILISRHLDDHGSGEGRVEVVFQRDEHWVTQAFSLKAIIDSKTMVGELGIMSVPVNSVNATDLVKWFDAFESANRNKIERVDCVSRCGWNEVDGVRTFVADEPLFARDGLEHPPLVLDTRGERRHIFATLKPSTEFTKHRDALAKAWNSDPVCAAMIAGALAAPLLKPLDAPNFAVHLPGDSSRGKTTMLKIAASVFGNPNSDHWVASWNTTSVAAELRAAALCDLPLCFDEVGAGDRQSVERLVYMLINGTGRTRGNRDLQMRDVPWWRTIVLSTGERGLVDETAATGAQVRVVQLPVSGIGALSAREVDDLREACAAHAGAFGRMWLQTLVDVDDWSTTREAYIAFRDILRKRATNNLQNRTAGYWALLCVAESWASEFGLGTEGAPTIQRLFAMLSRAEQIRPAAERARENVESWVYIEPHAFPELGRDAIGDTDPKVGRANVVHGYRRDDGAILLWPDPLRARLTEAGLSYEQVTRDWLKLGWIDGDAEGRCARVVKIHGRPKRMIVLLPSQTEVLP